jgi:multiple sugar transport system substrate-binding protein
MTTAPVLRRARIRACVLIFVGGLLVACGGVSASPTAAGPDASSGGGSQEEVTITFWKGPHSEREREIWGEVFRQFEAENPGIKVEHTIVPWETADQQYAAAFAGGSPPDIAYLPDQYMVGFADRGQLADIGAYGDSPEYAGQREAWYPNAWELGEYNGVQYGVPYAGGAYVIYANTTMWNDLGLGDPPESVDELIEYAQAGTDPASGTWGYLAPSSAADSSYFDWFQYFHNQGANFLNDSLTANGFGNEAGLKGLTFATDMYCTYEVTPPAGQYTLPQLVDLFIGGKALMMMEGMNTIAQIQAADPSFDWDIFMPPPGPEGDTTMGNQGLFVVSEASTHKEAAFKLISYVTSPEVLGPIIKQNIFRPLRTDMEDLYSDNPIANKAVEITKGRVRAYEGQLHPALREVLTVMWTEFEKALTCTEDPETALESAAEKVDVVVGD